LIITRTPFRISFFGGGTDYPAWYRENGGAVLSTSIDKYCYVSCRKLPPFFEHKHRIVYSKIENVKDIDEIEHPAVKSILRWANVRNGLELHHDGDLPARSGLGSSSSFTVGLIHALSALEGRLITKEELAKNALHVEQNLIGESVGSQDQIAAAYGGFNLIEFYKNGNFSVTPMVISQERLVELQSHLLLFFTGFSRIANEIAKSKIQNFKSRESELKSINEMVIQGINILGNPNTKIEEFGELLDLGWQQKRKLSDRVSTDDIDQIYSLAIRAGATGGKILGAGGGGFMLLFASPDRHSKITDSLNHLVRVNFKFEDSGSKVVLYQPNGL
jgi:D-glycero-alpha-D-manno-heptose-7-phosphate kinase